MACKTYLAAAFGSGATRITENLCLVTRDAECYLKQEIGFKEATDRYVKHPYFYASLTIVKGVCDIIVASRIGNRIYGVLCFVRSLFQDLVGCSFQAFINRIRKLLRHYAKLLGEFTIGLISCRSNSMGNKTTSVLSWFCTACNDLYLIISCTTNGLSKTIQVELTKYWLECMGTIRAIAESLNIDFVTYMEKCSARESDIKSMLVLDNDQSFDSDEPKWERVKAADITKEIFVSLEDIFKGITRVVPLTRTVREIGKTRPDTEEVNFTVTIDPGCADGKTFRFAKAGDRDPVNIPADLVVQIRTTPHPLYQRSGSDLIHVAKVSLSDALRGEPVQVPLIDGRVEECNPNGVIKPKTQIIIDHAGLPDPANPGIRGRLIIKFDIEFPDTKLGHEAS